MSVNDFLAAVVGLWTLLHFMCRLKFMPAKRSPLLIRYVIWACASSGGAVFFISLSGLDYQDAIMCLCVSLTLFEAVLWYDGKNDISNFYKRRERRKYVREFEKI